ncbi:7-methyl-GTP pyrophosphatase-like isoform X2 [Camellia sinensis]|uniref:7-methyl-GTP pyrophosphatase-like isoform X2 n=1 Tax=Camellia sinensis TaxID=4442 RepID=UPI00103559F7|nr:7-methyl-GTP pyrophosphatase-like isoform X2 [Camellia sinensis]
MAANAKNPPFKIILGSSSMARRQILVEMGYEFSIVTADIDEQSIRREKPEDLVMALAEAKADAIISRLKITSHLEDNAHSTLLITADTVVVYEGMIREKPSSKEEARQFIKVVIGVWCRFISMTYQMRSLIAWLRKELCSTLLEV